MSAKPEHFEDSCEGKDYYTPASYETNTKSLRESEDKARPRVPLRNRSDRRLTREELIQDFLHPLPMATSPINALAARTRAELLISLKDIRRNLLANAFLLDGLEGLIAHRATGETVPRFQPQFLEYLKDLLFQRSALYQKSSDSPPAGKFLVAGEKHSFFGHCTVGQFIIVHVGKVEGVITQDAKPFGKRTQHAIRYELHNTLLNGKFKEEVEL